jgi:hypothetical protein
MTDVRMTTLTLPTSGVEALREICEKTGVIWLTNDDPQTTKRGLALSLLGVLIGLELDRSKDNQSTPLDPSDQEEAPSPSEGQDLVSEEVLSELQALESYLDENDSPENSGEHFVNIEFTSDGSAGIIFTGRLGDDSFPREDIANLCVTEGCPCGPKTFPETLAQARKALEAKLSQGKQVKSAH